MRLSACIFIFLLLLSSISSGSSLSDNYIFNLADKNFQGEDEIELLLTLCETDIKDLKVEEKETVFSKISSEISLLESLKSKIEFEIRFAEILQNSGKKKEGIAIIEKWTEDAKKSQNPMYILGLSAKLAEVCFRTGEKKRAEELLEKVAKLMHMSNDNNSLAAGLCMKAKLLAKMEKTDEVLKLTKTIKDIIPEIVEDKIITSGEEIVQTIESSYLRTNLYMLLLDINLDIRNKKEIEEILKLADKNYNLIEYYEYKDEANASFARISAKMGKYEKSLEYLGKIGAFKLKNEISSELAGILIEKDQYELVKKLAEKNTETKYRNRIHALLAVYEGKKGKISEALKNLDKIKDILLKTKSLAEILSNNNVKKDPLMIKYLKNLKID